MFPCRRVRNILYAITLDVILNFRTLRHESTIEWDLEIGVLDMGMEAFRKFSAEPEIDPEIEYFV